MGLADRRVLSVQSGGHRAAICVVHVPAVSVWRGAGLHGIHVPHIPISFAGIDYSWNVLGYGVARNAAGEVVIGGGLGYFLSYEIRSFVAQCVNFPLQRNVTFKSHGNVAYQILWYFIAWVLISLFCNAINGLWLPLAQVRFDPAVYNLLVTFITGGVVHGDLLLRIQDHLPGASRTIGDDRATCAWRGDG